MDEIDEKVVETKTTTMTVITIANLDVLNLLVFFSTIEHVILSNL